MRSASFALILLLTTPLFAADLPTQPNILFILTDDQGYGDLSCHGNPILKTPNIDALYARSVRFTDFHVSPTCAPTRTALMTGRHEFHSGVTHTINERERMALASTTIAQPRVTLVLHRTSSEENRCGYNPARRMIPLMTTSRYGISRPAPGCFTVGLLQPAASHHETNHAIHTIAIADTGFITMQ